MIELEVPIVSQLTSITTDKQPSENREDDCVAASVLMLTMFLKGVKSLGGIYTPDNFKDQGAGQGYVGFTAAVQYIKYCASLGVRLYHQDGNQAQLIEFVKSNLSKKLPTIFTEPDPYMQGNFSHVCIFCADLGSSLVAIDPFIAEKIQRTYAEWQGMLQFSQVWTGELMQQGSTTQPLTATVDDMHIWNLAGVKPFYVDHAIEQSWLRAKHIKHIELGPAQEDEEDTGPDVRRLFLMGRAVWSKVTGIVTWYLCTGPFTF